MTAITAAGRTMGPVAYQPSPAAQQASQARARRERLRLAAAALLTWCERHGRADPAATAEVLRMAEQLHRASQQP